MLIENKRFANEKRNDDARPTVFPNISGDRDNCPLDLRAHVQSGLPWPMIPAGAFRTRWSKNAIDPMRKNGAKKCSCYLPKTDLAVSISNEVSHVITCRVSQNSTATPLACLYIR